MEEWQELELRRTEFGKYVRGQFPFLWSEIELCDRFISSLYSIHACFDSAALEKVLQASKSNEPFTLSFSSAEALARLNGKVENLTKVVHEALEIIISRHLKTKKIKALVIHILNGKAIKDFDPAITPIKKKVPKPKSPAPNTFTPQAPVQAAQNGLVPNGVVQAPVVVAQENLAPNGEGVAPITTISETVIAKPTPETPKEIKEPKIKETPIGDDLSQVWQGFKEAAIKGMLGKMPDNFWEALGVIAWKFPYAVIKFIGKIAWKILGFIWRKGLKPLHKPSKFLANYFVPLHKSSSSKTNKAQDPFNFIAHYAVYGFLLAASYMLSLGLLGQLFSPMRHWINSGAVYVFHLLVRTVLWGFYEILVVPWVSFGLCAILLFWIKKSFQPKFLEMIFYAALLLVAWNYKDWILQKMHITLPATPPSLYEAAKPTPAPVQAYNQNLSTPVRTLKVVKKSKAAVRPTPDLGIDAQMKALGVPKERQKDITFDFNYASEFTGNFYGMNYKDPKAWYLYFHGKIYRPYSEHFFNIYYYGSPRTGTVKDKKLILSFEPPTPPKLLKWDTATDEFLVEGSMTTTSDKNKPGEFISKEPVGLTIDFRHLSDGHVQVEKVMDMATK